MYTHVCECVRPILQCFNHAYAATTRCSSVISASKRSALRWNLRRNVFNAVTLKSKHLMKYSSNLVNFFFVYGRVLCSFHSISCTTKCFLSCSKIDLTFNMRHHTCMYHAVNQRYDCCQPQRLIVSCIRI